LIIIAQLNKKYANGMKW